MVCPAGGFASAPVIPKALSSRIYRLIRGQGSDPTGFVEEFLPGVAGGGNNVLVGVKDSSAEEVGFEILPDFFGRIEVGGGGRERDEGEVGGNREERGHMPTGSIHQQRRMDMSWELGTEGIQVVLHHFRVGGWQNQGYSGVALRAESPEQVSIGVAGIDRGGGAAPFRRPAPGAGAFLADPTLILTPQLDFLIGMLLLELGQGLGEFF